MKPAEFKAARKALGLTQTRLADALGMGETQVQCMESGRRAIRRTIELALESLARRQRDGSITEASVNDFVERMSERFG
jgi:transcriptional regulator with XRE-family HTH domain